MRPARPRPVFTALAATLAAAATLALAVTGAGATPTPAPAPTTSLDQVQHRKDVADKAVVDLNRRIARETAHLRTLSAAADRTRARYAAQVVARQHAADRVRVAERARRQAQVEYNRAHTRFVQLITHSVQQSTNPVADMAYAVLTADSPGEVLDAVQLGRLASENQASVVDAMGTAVDRRAAAERAQQRALADQTRLTTRLAADKKSAERQLAAARTALRGLQHDITKAKRSQLAAVLALSQFLGGWSMADPQQAAALNAHYRALAARAAKAKLPPNPGHWTPALGEYAAARALNWIGTPYAWAGGNPAGPTRGVCAGNGAELDCHLVGFDCSGLALYGWAPFRALPHLASTQYAVAGSVHPKVTQLLPGDLVFWSAGGAAGIHHVAIYIGDGNVVQAPQSGDIVRVTPLARVDSGYFGATRPLT